MFNVTVINVKKTLKYGTALIIALLIMYISTMNISKIENKEIMKINISEKLIGCIVQEIPAIENTYYKANELKEIELLKLTKRANNSELPKVEIIDLKQELANGNRSMLSNELYALIEENLQKKRQTILFLNRRGYSTFIMCRNCGYTVKCKNCDISLNASSFVILPDLISFS